MLVKRAFKVCTKDYLLENFVISRQQIAVEEKIIQCALPYAGEKGELIVKLTNSLKNLKNITWKHVLLLKRNDYRRTSI